MAIVLDYIASSLMFGILLLTVARIQININAALYQNSFSVRVQTNAVQLARQIETDFLHAGYKISGRKVATGDLHTFSFVNIRSNTNSTRDSVTYTVGTTSEATFSANPDDFPLKRTLNGTTLTQQWGLTKFRMWFYDSNNVMLTVPFSDATTCNTVRAIRVYFRIESPEAVISVTDTSYAAISWEKLIVPRNLNNLYY